MRDCVVDAIDADDAAESERKREARAYVRREGGRRSSRAETTATTATERRPRPSRAHPPTLPPLLLGFAPRRSRPRPRRTRRRSSGRWRMRSTRPRTPPGRRRSRRRPRRSPLPVSSDLRSRFSLPLAFGGVDSVDAVDDAIAHVPLLLRIRFRIRLLLYDSVRDRTES